MTISALAAATSFFVSPPFGLHLSEVCFRGDVGQKIAPVLRQLKYKFVARERTVNATQAHAFLAASLQGPNRVRKAAYYTKGWTHLFDPELVIMTEYKLLARLSKSWKTKIVTWLCESNSRSYGFQVFENGALVREVLAVDGDVTSKGKRLSEERSVTWRTATEDDVLNVAKRLGPSYEELPNGIQYRIFDLDQ